MPQEIERLEDSWCYKSFPLEDFKSAEGQEEGTFQGYASIFGNIDYGRDIIKQGAFAKTLKEKQGKLKLLDNHNAFNGQSARVGAVYLDETAKGLKVTKGVLNLNKLVGKEMWEDIKFFQEHGLPVEMSIGFNIVKWEYGERQGGKVRIIKEAALWEVSLVTFAMNPKAKVQSVKELEARVQWLEKQLGEALHLGAAEGPPEPVVNGHSEDERKLLIAKMQLNVANATLKRLRR